MGNMSSSPVHRPYLVMLNPSVTWLFHSGNHRPEWTSGQQIPPARVGDFIRTFPFNAATLKASQQQLDVKLVLQELHRLTAQLASSGRTPWRDEDVKRDKSCEEDFDSLLWGPQDPPLLSQILRRS